MLLADVLFEPGFVFSCGAYSVRHPFPLNTWGASFTSSESCAMWKVHGKFIAIIIRRMVIKITVPVNIIQAKFLISGNKLKAE